MGDQSGAVRLLGRRGDGVVETGSDPTPRPLRLDASPLYTPPEGREEEGER